MFAGTKRVHIGSSSKGGMVQCVEVCHLGESRPNAGIRHYSDIQCCQRAGLQHGQED